jgi:hypothetical protein
MLMSRSSNRQTNSTILLAATVTRQHFGRRGFALDLRQVAVLALRRPAGHLTAHDRFDAARDNASYNDNLLVTEYLGHRLRHHALRADLHHALLVSRHEALPARRIQHASSPRCG